MKEISKCIKNCSANIAISCYFVAILLVSVVLILAFSGDVYGSTKVEEVRIDKIVNTVADVKPMKYQISQEQEEIEQTYEKLKELSAKVSSEFSEPLLWYQAKCLQLIGKKEEFVQVCEEAIKKGIDTPDFLTLQIWMIDEGGGERTEARIKVWNEHGRIVPISLNGRDRDDRMAPAGKIDPPLPRVPVFRSSEFTISEVLVEIGELYQEMGFYREAINLYMEALYSDLFNGTGEKRSGLWLKIAELEIQQGQINLAIRAYLKSAYNHRKHAEVAIEGIQEIIRKATIDKSLTIEKVWSEKKVLRISELYRKLNLHPLALSLIERFEKEAEIQLSDEKEALREEWQEIVKKHIEVRGSNCHLLGQKVSEVEDWSQVHVLRPSDTFWKPSNNK